MEALFTDIDDTLIARGANPELLQAAQSVKDFLTARDAALVLVTGATYKNVTKRIESGEIPMPDAIISDVGTDIWLHKNGEWNQETAYQTWLNRTGYKKSEVILQTHHFISTLPAGYELTFQPPIPSAYKVSLHFMASVTDANMLAMKAREYFANFRIVVCQEIHYNATLPPHATMFKYCLDIVPATKADAVSYYIAELGITSGWKAGDSGNDVDMLLNPDPLTPILVGGYKPETLQEIEPLLKTESAQDSIRQLQDGRRIYIESGPERASQSLIKALRYLG